MKCHRCGGKMIYEKFYGEEEQFYGWRCIFCGEIVDQVISENRAIWKGNPFFPRTERSIFFHKRKEVIIMLRRRLLAVSLVLVFLAAFTLPALAQEMVKGKVEALDKEAKKISIAGTEYSLSDEAAKAYVKVGDEVEATLEAGAVKKLTVKKVKK